ncbi:orexin receptor type 2-like [Melanerpes formicivorus]|uniref:orexin receptor type 2-like n=1 Tax=Melanerpes formicivorus TaxID=211600 RepID=UPI00358F762D
MSRIQPENGSSPCRNWTTGSELNETLEALLTPSSDYDNKEFLRYLWKEYLHPKEYEWALIAVYIVVFIVALVGNVLVGLLRIGKSKNGPETRSAEVTPTKHRFYSH